MTVLGLARVGVAGLLCLGCVFLFQLCYSVGPVYLAKVISGNSTRNEVVVAVLVFLFLYFLPYPLTFAASCLRVFWKTGALRAFYQLAFSSTFGRPAEAVRSKSQKEFAGIVSATGQDTVSDCVDFVYGTASLVFSSSLSVLLISTFIFRDFVVSYLVSAALCWGVVWYLGTWQTQKAEIAEEGYNRFVSALPGAWTANSLGEAAIMKRFTKIFDRRWMVYRGLALRAMVAFQSFAMLQAACIWVPTSVLVLYRIRFMDLEQIIALGIVLPRLTETLLDVSNLVSNIGDYLGLRGRTDWLKKALATTPVDLRAQVDEGSLRLLRRAGDGWNELDIASIADLVGEGGPAGRYILRGPNGSGKTSLLLHLKSLHMDSALYLPALSRLFPELGQERSTGQTKSQEISLVLQMVEGGDRVLLLDEWDANLDRLNRERISAQIDEIARRNVVIEVTHSHHPAHEIERSTLR